MENRNRIFDGTEITRKITKNAAAAMEEIAIVDMGCALQGVYGLQNYLSTIYTADIVVLHTAAKISFNEFCSHFVSSIKKILTSQQIPIGIFFIVEPELDSLAVQTIKAALVKQCLNELPQVISETIATVYQALCLANKYLIENKIQYAVLMTYIVDFSNQNKHELAWIVLAKLNDSTRPVYAILDDKFRLTDNSQLVLLLDTPKTNLLEENYLMQKYSKISQQQNNARYIFSSKSLLASMHENIISMFNLIAASLSVYYQILPASGQKILHMKSEFLEKNFTKALMTYPWLINKSELSPKAAVHILNSDKNKMLHIGVTKAKNNNKIIANDLQLKAKKPLLFLIAGDNFNSIVKQLYALENTDYSYNDLKLLSQNSIALLNQYQYQCVILATNNREFQEEISYILKGVNQLNTNRSDWRTLRGSYITLKPLIKEGGKIVFVYPGMGNAYPGCARELLIHQPGLYEKLNSLLDYQTDAVMQTPLIYPNSITKSAKELYAQSEYLLNADAARISSASIAYPWLYTGLIKDLLSITPDYAIGYSIGEISMLIALGIWEEPRTVYNNIMKYPTFTQALAGPMFSVRAYWEEQGYQLKNNTEPCWQAIIIKSDARKICEEITKYSQLYLMTINTPNEIMVGGYPETIKEFLTNLSLNEITTPLKLAMHSEPAWREKENLKQMFTIPVKISNVKLYSSGNYDVMQQENEIIADTITKAICSCVDFPKLINKVHDDGGRIFIEIGPRDNCSYWINQILSNKEHITVPLNIKNLDEYICLYKAIALLISHGAKFNPAALLD